MSRHLVADAASLTLSACVVQPPPGYYGRPVSPNSQAYYPQAYPPGWHSPPVSLASYSPPPQASYAPPSAAPPSAAPPSAAPPSESYATAEPYSPQFGSDFPSEPRNPRATFADETVDYRVPPTKMLHLRDFDAPTPTLIEGARTITTLALQSMLTADRPPLLVDVIGGEQSVTLTNAVWMHDAGVARHLDDDIQAWVDLHLSRMTGRDKSRPLVFFCASRMCWLAHNATLRALNLGYTDVSWYRGGRDAWQTAGLPMAPVAPPPS